MRRTLSVLAGLAIGLLTAGSVTAQFNRRDTYPLMRPDPATLQKWTAAYAHAPTARLLPGRQGLLTATSLLGHLDYVPAERDQGMCGDCWQWAGTGCMEILLDTQNGIFDRLSVQYLNSCVGATGGPACCDGGWLLDVANFYKSAGYQAAVPWSNPGAQWQDGDASCDTACASITTVPHYPISDIQEYSIPTTGVGTDTAIANIKNILDQGKPVWFSWFMASGSDWTTFFNAWNTQSEAKSIDFDYACGHDWDSGGGGHAVLCVGYNDNDPTNRYWIIVNSWGVPGSNRPNGLFRLSMDLNYDCSFTQYGSAYQSYYFQYLDVTYDVSGIGCRPPEAPSAPFPPNHALQASAATQLSWDNITSPLPTASPQSGATRNGDAQNRIARIAPPPMVDATAPAASGPSSGGTLPAGLESTRGARDDFNRPDSTDMGPNWVEQNGDWRIESNRARSANSTSWDLMTFSKIANAPTLSADVFYTGAHRLCFAALVSKYADLTNNILVKVQDNDGDGQYDSCWFYYGNGSTLGWPGMTGGGSSTNVTPFTQARITTRVAGDAITLEIDRDFDGVPEDTITRGGLPSTGLGNGIGLGGYNNVDIDNFALGGGISCYTLGGEDLSGYGSDMLIGNVLTVLDSQTLKEIKLDLDFTGTTNFYFYVMESTAESGPYTPVFEKQVTLAGVGQAMYSSGPMDFTMLPGKSYLVGAAWGGLGVTVYGNSVTTPANWDLGALNGYVWWDGAPPYASAVDGFFSGVVISEELCLVAAIPCQTRYDVYFGTENPPSTLIASRLSAPACDPGPLVRGTAYHWQVVAHNEDVAVPGPVWEFATEGCPPPPAPHDPTPLDWAANQPTNTILTWNGEAPTGLAAFNGGRTTPTSAGLEASATVLVYADDPVHAAPGTYVDRALTALGLTTEAHYNGDFAGFTNALASKAWTLVIFANDEAVPPASTLSALQTYVGGGGRLIAHSWVVDGGHPLWAAMGVTVAQDDTSPPDPVHWWTPTHPIFTFPESVPEFTELTDLGAGWVFGEHVEPAGDGVALAGYTGARSADEAALVLANDGRTIFRGFLDVHNDADLDADGLPDGMELWINLIEFEQHKVACEPSYDVYMDTANPPVARIATGLTSPSVDPGALLRRTTYYWQVASSNESGVTYGPIWRFTTEGGCPPPETPYGPSPADGAMGLSVNTLLKWNAGWVVVPNANETVEGDSNNSYPFNTSGWGINDMRYQQIYAANEIGRAGTISQIRFRPDVSGAPFGPTNLQVDVYLGYAATGVTNASTTFAENIGPGRTHVYSGTLTLSSAATGSGPRDFDIVVDVDDAFTYDPANGPLLLDVFMRSSPGTTYFDAAGNSSPPQSATTRIYADGVDSPVGSMDSQPRGLVTMFCFDGQIPPAAPGGTAGRASTLAAPAPYAGPVVFPNGGTLVRQSEAGSADAVTAALSKEDLLKAGVFVPGAAQPAAVARRPSSADRSCLAAQARTLRHEALDALARVAIFQDANPWGSTWNQDILGANGISYTIFNSSQMGIVDLTPFDKVIIASAQPSTFYAALTANRTWFEAYVNAGGFLDMHLAWVESENALLLPGGFVAATLYVDEVHIADPSHALVTAPHPIAASELNGWNASAHGYFAALPSDARTIIEIPGGGLACAAETRFGGGRIVATLQPVEDVDASRNYLENMILYEMPVCRTLYDVWLYDATWGWRAAGTGLTEPVCNAGTLTPNSTYYWTVTAYNGSGVEWGPYWSFATESGNDFAAVTCYAADPGDIWTPLTVVTQGEVVAHCAGFVYSGATTDACVRLTVDGTPSEVAYTFYSGSWVFYMPTTAATLGPHHLRLDCDTSNEVSELSESNNTWDANPAYIGAAGLDYGDAPAGYATLLASDGARHGVVSNLYMGAWIDSDPNGQPDASATGDDTHGLADDDGVFFPSPLKRGAAALVAVTVSATNGLLSAWIDFDRDGHWWSADEEVFTDVPLTTAGTHYLAFYVPQWAGAGDTFMRFRYSTMPGLNSYGPAPDGEVEDYKVQIQQAPPPGPIVITDMTMDLLVPMCGVGWSAYSDVIYQVQCATNLMEHPVRWQDVGGQIWGPYNWQYDTNTLPPLPRYYRVIAPNVSP